MLKRMLPGALVLVVSASAAMADDDARAAMQRALNAEVLAAPFDPGDVNKAKAYADAAIKKDIKPVVVAPTYWRPGWTCGHLTRYRYYRYRDYRNCVYHHRYYGRYW